MDNTTIDVSYNDVSNGLSNATDNTSNVVGVPSDEITLLNNIHTDLGVICSFIVFFALVVILKYVYKFFNMFFVI